MRYFFCIASLIATLTLSMSLLVPVHSSAAIWIQSALSLVQEKEELGQSASSTTSILSSNTVGISFIQGFFIGAQGLIAGNNSTDRSIWAIGPKGGLLIRGVEITAAYLPIVRETRGTTSYSGGGFALNLGYSLSIVGPLRLGLQGTYWSMSFSDQNRTTTYLSPLISIGFGF